MVTNAYVPLTTVEIAFTSNYSTPYASHVWTDVTDWAELDLGGGLTIERGRQDEQSTADSNSLAVVLDNRDGRFTPNRAASPYYPNVKVGRPIRVRTTVNSVTYLRFYGYVDEWPTTWVATAGMSYVPITARSRLARLGLQQPLLSTLDEEILADNPVAFYKLDEASGATTGSDLTGTTGVPALAPYGPGTAPTWGADTGLTLFPDTGAQINAGRYFRFTTPGMTAFEFFFRIAAGATTTLDQSIAEWRDAAGNLIQLQALGSVVGGVNVGKLRVLNNGSVVSGPSDVTPINDGRVHHLAVRVISGPSYQVLLDGAILFSGGSVSGGQMATVAIGGQIDRNGGGVSLTGVVSRIAVYTTTPTDVRFMLHTSTAYSAFSGETAGDRFRRLARYAGVPAADVASSATTAMSADTSAGGSTDEALRRVEAAEGGVVWDDGEKLTLISRVGRYTATAIVTLDVTLQQVEASYAPKVDRTGLLNDVTAANPDGSASSREVVASSRDEYGVHAASLEMAVADPNDLQAAASWLANAYSTPYARVGSLSVDLLVLPTAAQQALLGAKLGDLITVTNQPTQAAATSASYFIEGASEVVGSAYFAVTLNVSPAEPYLNTFLLGDSTRGVLDAGYLLRW